MARFLWRLAVAACLILGTVATSSAAQIGVAQAQPMRLAILPFDIPFYYFNANALSTNVTDLVEEAMFNTGHYRLVDRRTLLQVLREQGLGLSALADPDTAAKVGKVLGVQALVTGTVNVYELQNLGTVFGTTTLYRAVVRLTARAVQTETSEVLGIARGAGEARGVHPPARGRKAVMEVALEESIKDLVGKLDGLLQQGR